MEYGLKLSEPALALVIEGLQHLPINRALDLLAQVEAEAQRQRELAAAPPPENKDVPS